MEADKNYEHKLRRHRQKLLEQVNARTRVQVLQVKIQREVVARIFANKVVDNGLVKELVVVEQIENAGGEDQHFEDAKHEQNLLSVRFEQVFETSLAVGEKKVERETESGSKIQFS